MALASAIVCVTTSTAVLSDFRPQVVDDRPITGPVVLPVFRRTHRRHIVYWIVL